MSIRPASPRSFARFQRAAAQYGGKVLRAEWEPLGIHMVFDGPIGGWRVKVRFGGYTSLAIGSNIEAAIKDIEYQGKEVKRALGRYMDV